MPTRNSKTRKHRGHVSAGHGRVGKHRKHPGGRGLAGGQHHHRTNFDKYHPGYFGKVGMRHFHLTRNLQWRPIINVDKLWTLVPAEEKQGLTASSEVVPVIDTLSMVTARCWATDSELLFFGSRAEKSHENVKAAQAAIHCKSSVCLGEGRGLYRDRGRVGDESSLYLHTDPDEGNGIYISLVTRQLHQTPYLARVDTNASRMATEMTQQAVVIDMGHATGQEVAHKEKKADTLFGPNIGIVSGGPEWTEREEKSGDELTPEIVKKWIAKSKENNYSTTTLQALVNLKRPTLRLTPLEIAPSDDPNHVDSQHHHGLEFEYDCDAPKCSIHVYVLLSPKHPLAGKPDTTGFSKVLVYEAVVDGGFGKFLKLEEGATLELGRFDHRTAPTPPIAEQEFGEASVSSATDLEQQLSADPSATEPTQRKKRFTTFHFRKRTEDRSVAGPALVVVDAEAHAPTHDDEAPREPDKNDEDDVGVRVTIRLSALDEEGKDLPSVNEQVTYLHIVKFGAPPVAIEGEVEEDNRPWVVKVVKREATIGPHTFHLHEIYGLSANSTSSQPAPASPLPTLDTHVYLLLLRPPQIRMKTSPPPSACYAFLLPEVVLLRRHLVACRECAINMIEFGAGGNIVHTESETNGTTGADGANGDNGNGNGAEAGAMGRSPWLDADVPVPVPIPALPTNTRRKPYTSLLRITTTPPSKGGKDEHRESTSIEDHVPMAVALPPPAANPPRGHFASLTRPNFLRFGRSGAQQTDLERGQAQSMAHVASA
ncbi:hypothetical protein A0H81_12385 [Grifola frondosa]|uniref:Uncharacterized protein n=1 Tax=Grifola frondosa TaxID=5627 RepID=A0A1C7LYC3_GRIFR|nr:hypothetical protein A0H81_12385 [Grifola frondosa]